MDPPVAGVAALRPWFTGKEEGPRWIRWEAPGSWFTGREEGPSWTRWWQGSQHWDRGSPAKRQDRGGPASVKEEASSWIRWKLLGLWFTRKEETPRRVTRQEKGPRCTRRWQGWQGGQESPGPFTRYEAAYRYACRYALSAPQVHRLVE